MKKLPNRYARIFTARELQQGRHLRKSLRTPKQTKHGHTAESLRPLKKTSAQLLDAHNGYARARWFRYLASLVSEQIGARPPHWQPTTTVFFVTLVDRLDLVKDTGDEFELTRDKIDSVKSKFTRMLAGLNYVGMIDVTLYVSTQTTLGAPRALLPHGHFIVWGCDWEIVDEVCAQINGETRPLLPYASAAKWEPVRDLLQVCWYVSKMPRSQYQLWRRRGGKSLKQYNRHINGANAVRLYEAMPDVTLTQLISSGGQGVTLVEELKSEVLASYEENK